VPFHHYHDGYNAYLQGSVTNPHPHNSEPWNLWEKGYEAAFLEDTKPLYRPTPWRISKVFDACLPKYL
jgi:hypothetical protein